MRWKGTRKKEAHNVCIYAHISPSRKVYVGQTTRDPESRWNYGNGYKANRYMYSAVKKYGWAAFEHVILAKDLTQDEANTLEQNFITLFKSADRRYGYNIQEGGRSAGGMSDEAKAHMIALKSGDNAPNARDVAVFDLDGKRVATFTCISYAALAYGIRRGTLITHLRKGTGTCHNLIFRYVDDVGDCSQLSPDEIYYPHEKRSLRRPHEPKRKGNYTNEKRPVCKYSLDGKFICRYGSVKEAALANGIGYSALSFCVCHNRFSSGGFRWRYDTGDYSDID